jgi:NTE family protein
MSVGCDNQIRATPETAHPAALIVAGAAARGPFAAGALGVLARHQHRFQVSSVVGTSAGALNAALYAAGLRVGQAAGAAARAEALWRDKAGLPRILSWRFRKQLVLDALAEFASLPRQREVKLQMVVTSLPGEARTIGTRVYTSFEKTYTFTAQDLASDDGIDLIAEVAIASAALPVIFAPRTVRGDGPFQDGGLVDNTPIGKAIDGAASIDNLIIIVPEPAVIPRDQTFSRLSFSRLTHIVIAERLARDILTARAFNDDLDRLQAMGVDMNELRAKLQWRRLELHEIRPDHELPGGFLGGFLSRRLRDSYLDEGRRAAERTMGAPTEDFARL